MSTDLLPDSKEAQDSKYNPGALKAAETFPQAYAQSGIDRAEAFANDSGNSSHSLKESEETSTLPGGNMNYTGNGGKQKVSRKAWFRRKGPLSAIFALIIGGGAGLTMLGSPALLIVHFKEIMVEKFNTQLASMDDRTSRVMSAKITSTTSGHCGTVISIRCKFSSMTDTQIKKFEDAGIKVTGEEKTAIRGRTKPTVFEFNGKTITAAEFNNEIIKNPEFKSAVKQAYSSKFSGLAGKAWNTIAKRMGLQKKPPFDGTESGDDARAKKLQDSVKNGAQSESLKPFTDEEKKGKSQAEIDARNAAIAEQARLQAEVQTRNTATDVDSTISALEEGAKNGVGVAANALKVTGAVDIACQGLSAIRNVGTAAKTVRVIQLARYAMVFLSVADSIKAGKAKPDEVAYAGKLLTEIKVDEKGVKKNRAATDSAGFKYAAYGETTGFKKDSKTSQFMAGGGLTGQFIDLSNTLTSIAGGGNPKAAKTTCQTVANPWVQGVSLLGGVALMFTGVGTVLELGKAAAQAGLQAAVMYGISLLPELLKDIVAGNVTNGISGEDTGNAVASGSDSTLSQVAAANGNAPMSKEDALAYNNVQQNVIAQNNELDRLTLSPFDPTNKNTFLGSIVSSLIPYSIQLATPSTAISSMGSFLGMSVSSLIPKSSALSTEQQKEALNGCTDPDYVDMGIATDPFCNVIYGIPPKYLNKAPLQVIDELGSSNIDQTTGAPVSGSAYEKFVNNCITRDVTKTPLGQDEGGSDGTECKINDSNADYYLYYMDNTINDSMDTGDKQSDSSQGDSSNVNSGAGVNDGGWAYPVEKSVKVSQPFGYSASYGGVHNGVDFPLPIGSPFYAVRDGTVKNEIIPVTSWCQVGSRIGTTQNQIIITSQVNGQTYISVYAHVSEFKKKDGDTVKAGDLIGLTGDSGCSTGPHAHLSIAKGTSLDGVIDPLPLITR